MSAGLWTALSAGAAALALGMAVDASASVPLPSEERTMREYLLAETEVATLGPSRVALAKTWEESRDGANVLVAWLSVVDGGPGARPRSLERSPGESLAVGEFTFDVIEITVGRRDTPGTVLLREHTP
jgi:hypothetical protein